MKTTATKAKPTWTIDKKTTTEPNTDEPKLADWLREARLHAWRLHSAGPRGITFRCDDYRDIEKALKRFIEDMEPVMQSWQMTGKQISVTIL
jgi:hypothetical protein